MKRERRTRLYVIVALAIVVGATTVAYAALQTTLNISGYVNQKGGTWDIHFENVGNITTTGKAELKSSQIQTNGTDLYFSADLTDTGDTVSFTVDVVNGGTRDARLVNGKISIEDDNGVVAEAVLDGSSSDIGEAVVVTAKWVDGTNITGSSSDGELLDKEETKTLQITVSRNSEEEITEDNFYSYKLELNYQQK